MGAIPQVGKIPEVNDVRKQRKINNHGPHGIRFFC